MLYVSLYVISSVTYKLPCTVVSPYMSKLVLPRRLKPPVLASSDTAPEPLPAPTIETLLPADTATEVDASIVTPPLTATRSSAAVPVP